jgi:threonine dehydrogenase-like Zn-dependent dehydrogenase
MMKAISLVEPRHIEIVDVPEPEIGPEDVIIELRYVGLCGSDLSAYRGLSPMVSYPRILGHEVSGVIAAKGGRVPERLPVGAQVTVSPYTHCGLCPACRVGRVNTCQFNQTLGVQRDGALTERISVPYRKVYTSRVLSLQELALVEPLSVGYHAANRGRVIETDTVLVLGCGAIGLGVVAAAARKGGTVIAVDIDDAKLRQAASLGAQYLVNTTHDDLQARVDELTGGEGASVAIEAVGLPQTTQAAVERAAFAGRVVFIGYARQEIALQTKWIVSKELDVVGSRNALHVFPSVIKMLEKRERPFASLITCLVPFAGTPAAFAAWDADPTQFTKIMVRVE